MKEGQNCKWQKCVYKSTSQTHTHTNQTPQLNNYNHDDAFVHPFISNKSLLCPIGYLHFTAKKMDPKLQNVDNTEPNSTEEQQDSLPIQSPFATLSFSFSLPKHLSPLQPKFSTFFSQPPNTVKVLPPTQAASLTHNLSLSSPSKLSFKSTISANPLQNPLSLGPLRPLDPNNGAAIRRASIVWFRNDLRVHDNECLNSANNESMSVLPVYCFDPRDYGKSSSGFDKTGPYRASFLIESVADLRKNLQARGSELVVRVGKPEDVLVELVKAVGADAVYAHREVSHDEVKSEEKIEAAMKEEGVDVKYFWGSTLYHVDDLPFKLEEMPTNYGGFREKVQSLEVRKTIAALDQLKGKPARGDVEPGDIPTLLDLGLNPSATMSQVYMAFFSCGWCLVYENIVHCYRFEFMFCFVL